MPLGTRLTGLFRLGRVKNGGIHYSGLFFSVNGPVSNEVLEACVRMIHRFAAPATARIIRSDNPADSPNSLGRGAPGLFAVTNPRDRKWEKLKTPFMRNQAA